MQASAGVQPSQALPVRQVGSRCVQLQVPQQDFNCPLFCLRYTVRQVQQQQQQQGLLRRRQVLLYVSGSRPVLALPAQHGAHIGQGLARRPLRQQQQLEGQATKLQARSGQGML
jgi:hypothetical protein